MSTKARTQTSDRLSARPRNIAILLCASALAGHSAWATDYTWDPDATAGIQGGSGTWNASTGNTVWTTDGGTTHAAFVSGTTNPVTFAGADGSYSVTVGANLTTGGSTFSTSGYVLSAASSVTILNVGNFTVASGKSVTIGNNVKVTRASSVPVTGGGTLRIDTGGTINASGNSLSVTGGSELIVAGGTASVSSNLPLVVGSATGGTLTLSSGTVTAGTGSGATAGLRVANGVSTSGIVNLNGGIIQTGQVYQTGGTSTFNLNGGVLQAGSNSFAGTFMQGLTTANVKGGGAKIDTNAFDITIAQPLLHFAGATTDSLTKSSTGKLTLTGANTYTGVTTITGGTLALSSTSSNNIASSSAILVGDTVANRSASLDVTGLSSGTIALGAGKKIGGHGSVTGGISIVGTGILAPGASAGILTDSSLVTLADGALFQVEIGGTSVDLGTGVTSYDVLKLTGTSSTTLDLNGATNMGHAILDVSLIGGYIPSTLTPTSYVIVDNASNVATPQVSDVFKLADGTVLTNNTEFLVGTARFKINYNVNGGLDANSATNDVVLTTIIPEPAMLCLAAITAMGTLLRRRRA